ncbi:MAG TPA: hypothetical protein VD835_09300 [Pyrinomonadaceae bacterium]|nr:hypothetical protein [Pyrinomonadaceae bacterium]
MNEVAPDLAEAIGSLNPKLGQTLLASSFAPEGGQDMSEAIARLSPVINDIRQGGQAVTVAVLDIDARVGRLLYVLEQLNASQPVFTFFDLQAPLPAGLVIRSDSFDSWARHRAKVKRVKASDKEQFQDNLMFNDFYKYAQVVRKTAGVDYLVGVTQYMVAGEEDGEYYWNYFSTAFKHVILVSAYDLREYARASGRPFEVAVAGVMLAQLLEEMNRRVEYHEDRGCLFDMNVSRVSIIEALKQGRIEPDCLAKIEPKYRPAAEAMMETLRSYTRPDEPAPPAKPRQAKHDDTYWLEQLNRLSDKLKKVSGK